MKQRPPRTNRKLRWGLALLGLLAALAALADVVAPYDPATQHRDFPFAPPAKLRWVDADGRRHWRPFVYAVHLAAEMEGRAERRYVEMRDQRFSVRLFVAAEDRPWIPWRLFGVDEPAHLFLLGTDALGRDVLSRLLHGARLSLTIAAAALLISFPLGLLAGSVAGYYGGLTDFLLMRWIELFLALPALYLVIALRGALPLDLPPERVFAALAVVIALFGWAHLARVVRGMTLSLRRRDFVLAATALGASDRRILWRHILPHLTGFALTQAAVAAPGFILAEVTLSYLGLGVQEPLASWGNMLAAAQSVQTLGNAWWNLAPAAAIFVVSLAFHLTADGLRARFDPRSPAAETTQQLW